MIVIEFELLPTLLGAGGFVAAACLMTFVLVKISAVRRRIAADNVAEAPKNVTYPGVSIIVTSDDGTNLPSLLPALLQQRYPGPFEVILVDAGESPIASRTVYELQKTYSNLYMTFSPTNTRNLSRRKLAITIGIKAAAHDCLLLTRCDCLPADEYWLLRMARHFATGSDVVLGYSYPVDEEGRIPTGHGTRYRSFDTVRDSLCWLGAALSGRPVRGDGNNLGYRRSTFFAENGFSRSLDLVRGDDDVFVEQISSKGRVAVELAIDAQMAVTGQTEEQIKMERTARVFTSRRLRRAPFLAWGAASSLAWIWLGLGLAAALTALPQWLYAVIVSLPALLLWIPMCIAWRRISRALHHRPCCFTLPWMMLTRPWRTLLWAYRTRRSRRNLTWHIF